MPRVYLIFILIAVLLTLVFGEEQYLFLQESVSILGRQESINFQIFISGLGLLLLFGLLLFGFVEKIFYLFKSNKKKIGVKAMAVKKE